MKNPIRRNRPERTGIGAPLGDLELTVMRHIWACGPTGCQAADVQRALQDEHPSALTTILTTLDRLLTKGIVRRERDGKAYRYWAIYSEGQLQQRIVAGVMDRLMAQFPQAVAAYFAQQALSSETTANTLNDLTRRVQAAGENRQSLGEKSLREEISGEGTEDEHGS